MPNDAYFEVPTPLTDFEKVMTEDQFDLEIPTDNNAGREDTVEILAVSHEITTPRDSSSTNDDKDEQADRFLPGDEPVFTDGTYAQQGGDVTVI